jgi:hypothetical protein
VALDANLQLYDAALDAQANGVAVVGSWVNLGRVGLPDGAQFIVGVDGAAMDANDACTTQVQLQITVDNNTSRDVIAEHTFDIVGGVAYDGQQVAGIARDFNVQEYASANVDVRVKIIPTSDNVSNNITATKVYAYIGAGEKQTFGRLTGADTLAT